jgi:hypothetical protein
MPPLAGNTYYKTEEGGPVVGMMSETELYPYVSLSLNIDL